VWEEVKKKEGKKKSLQVLQTTEFDPMTGGGTRFEKHRVHEWSLKEGERERRERARRRENRISYTKKLRILILSRQASLLAGEKDGDKGWRTTYREDVQKGESIRPLVGCCLEGEDSPDEKKMELRKVIQVHAKAQKRQSSSPKESEAGKKREKDPWDLQ